VGAATGKGFKVLDDLISAVASRYGFRESDYRVIWDGQEFSGNRDPHQLVIFFFNDTATTETISEATLWNSWGPIRDIEDAFKELAGRKPADPGTR